MIGVVRNVHNGILLESRYKGIDLHCIRAVQYHRIESARLIPLMSWIYNAWDVMRPGKPLI
jgi:hypothetical protein